MTILDHPLVVGGGAAGLTVGLGLDEATLLVGPGPGSTPLAQGGIAAAVGPDDDPRLHAADTLRVGCGLSDPEVVEGVCNEAPSIIEWLVALGARFDRLPDGNLRLGREAGHSRRRIVHASGDGTGRELMRVLGEAVERSPRIHRLAGWTVADLLVAGRRVAGVVAADPDGRLVEVLAPVVVLATGGLARLFARTTNPPGASGDGMAMAARAGAVIDNPEFVQFHPTVLDSDLDPMPLLTEALRGEGARLVLEDGTPVMEGVHPHGDLAPRDVVARAVWAHRREGRRVFLDTSAVPGMSERFPTVWAAARRAGYDPDEPLPVTPAAHYTIGGVEVDRWGRTNLAGLWAVGEVASTGMHGANRLASNSLLEAMVMGRRAARAINRESWKPPAGGEPTLDLELPLDPVPEVEEARRVIWDSAGVVRSGSALVAGLARLTELAPALEKSIPGRTVLGLGRSILSGALRRTTSVGVHYRVDRPE